MIKCPNGQGVKLQQTLFGHVSRLLAVLNTLVVGLYHAGLVSVLDPCESCVLVELRHADIELVVIGIFWTWARDKYFSWRPFIFYHCHDRAQGGSE